MGALFWRKEWRHMNNIKDLPVNDRPYEKCFAKGPEYLTDVSYLQ